jgi:hypothetical protein
MAFRRAERLFRRLDSTAGAGETERVGRLLVGRARELERFVAALDDARAGRGAALLASGEAGLGKSRLAEELARLARKAGLQVSWGRCWEAGHAPPFWPWTQVLRGLGLEDLPTEATAPDRLEAFDGLARRLLAVAGPVVLILEDLHLADSATLLFLAFLVPQLATAPVLLFGTYRDVEARLTPEREALLARVARSAETLPLRALERAEVAHLVADALAKPPDELVDTVFRTTEGNPLFVEELLRVLQSRGSADAAIPAGVRATIREHLSRLQPGSRPVLEAAAVLGRELAAAELVELAGETAEVALADAVRAGLLTELRPRHFRFSHVLVRDTLYDDLAAGRRAELHGRAAQLLSALHGTDPEAPLAEIARHFSEAGPAFAALAVDYAVRASRTARVRLAFEEAAPLLERALRLVSELAPPDVARQGELLVELTEARVDAGDSEGARAACRQAAAIARRLGSADLLVRAALAFGRHYTFGRVDSELVSLLEEALGGGITSAQRALLLARLAGAMQPARDPMVPIARAHEAIEVARRLDDETTLLAVLVGAGSALQDIADPGDRLPLNRELVRLATARGDRALELRGRGRLAFDHLEGQDPAAADAEMRAYERVAQGFRQPRHHFLPAMWWAMRALGRGRWDQHARQLAEARRLAGDDPNAARCLGCHAFLAARLRGEPEQAASLVTGARWFLDAVPSFVAITEAVLLVDQDRPAEARTALLRVPIEDHLAAVPTIMCRLLAEAVAATGDAALAGRVHQALLPLASRMGVWSMSGMFCEGPIARHLALLAATAGDWSQAEAHWSRAEEVACADDMAAILVHLALDHAQAASRRGDPAVTASLAVEARSRAEALALPGLAARAARLIAPTGLAPSAPAALRLDGDVWVLAGPGESSRLRDSRGLRILARLLDNPGRELHALELAGEAAGDELAGGDAGEVLDETARAAYRARLADLRRDMAEAEGWNDPARLERARTESEALTRQLTSALGLGGRVRRAGAVAERARVNVQRRLADTIRRIQEVCPRMGRHLAETVHTGTFCCYDPRSPKRPPPA